MKYNPAAQPLLQFKATLLSILEKQKLNTKKRSTYLGFFLVRNLYGLREPHVVDRINRYKLACAGFIAIGYSNLK